MLHVGEILLISSSTLPGLGRVSAKNVNKPTDFNTAVSSPDDGTGWALCHLAHGELVRLFHEPHTGLDDCPRMLQECYRKRMSGIGTTNPLSYFTDEKLYGIMCTVNFYVHSHCITRTRKFDLSSKSPEEVISDR